MSLQEVNHNLADLPAQARAGLVQVHRGDRGTGAGAVWSPDGLIITNAHVVLSRQGQASHSLHVTLADGRQLPATIQRIHAEHDLAVLRVDAANLTPVPLGDSRRLQVGELVFALGFPWGIEGGATVGVVIGVGATLPELGDGRHDWIAASVHLRPGHSGGPMLDSLGRLVGINTLMTGPEVGAAVPLHVIEDFMRDRSTSQPLGHAGRVVHV